MTINYSKLSPPSATRGRGLIATQVVRPGDIIAVFDDPNRDIAIPDSYHLSTSCSYCLQVVTGNELIDNYNTTLTSPAVKLKACTGCRAVYYCGATCQKKDWTRVHKKECKVFQRLKNSEFATGHDALPTGVRALVQVLLRDEVRSAVEGLESHMEDFRRAGDDGKSMSRGGKQEDITSWKDMQLQAMAALHYLGRGGNEKEMMEAMEVLCKLQVNSFNRLDTDIGQTGQFLNTQLAMVNHSCMPNAYVQFTGRPAFLRASQAIKEGDEIEISYIDDNLHLSARQTSLKARYHFHCICPACSQNLDIYQACKLWPHHDLNKPFTLLTPSDISLIQNPPQASSSQQSLSQNPSLLTLLTQEIYPKCTTSIPPQISSNPSSYRKLLRERWSLTSPLRKLSLYAIEPLPQILTETAIFLAESSGSTTNSSNEDEFYYGSSLSLWLFLAFSIEPYRNPLPCAPWRIKVLLMIVRILGNAAAAAASTNRPAGSIVVSKTGGGGGAIPTATTTAEAKIARVLADMDIVTTSQVLLLLILHSSHHLSSSSSSSSTSASTSTSTSTSSSASYSQPNNPQASNIPPQPPHILSETRKILEEINSLPGRESEAKLVANFFRKPQGVEEKLFFDMVILKPLREIASFAEEVMDNL